MCAKHNARQIVSVQNCNKKANLNTLVAFRMIPEIFLTCVLLSFLNLSCTIKPVQTILLFDSSLMNNLVFHFYLDPNWHAYRIFSEHHFIHQTVFSEGNKNWSENRSLRNSKLVQVSVLMMEGLSCERFSSFAETFGKLHLTTDALSLILVRSSKRDPTIRCAMNPKATYKESTLSFIHTPVLKVLLLVDRNHKFRNARIICNGYCTIHSSFNLDQLNFRNKSALLKLHRANFRVGGNGAIQGFIDFVNQGLFTTETQTKQFGCNQIFRYRNHRLCWIIIPMHEG